MKVSDSGGYQLLETIRQYAIEQLTAAGEIDAVRDRHARFYLAVAHQACAGLMIGPEPPHLDVIARIDDNLRVALARLLVIEPQAPMRTSVLRLPASRRMAARPQCGVRSATRMLAIAN